MRFEDYSYATVIIVNKFYCNDFASNVSEQIEILFLIAA